MDEDEEQVILIAEERRKLITAKFIENDNGSKLLIVEFRKNNGHVITTWAPTWEALRKLCKIAIATESANLNEGNGKKDEFLKWMAFGDEIKTIKIDRYVFSTKEEKYNEGEIVK